MDTEVIEKYNLLRNQINEIKPDSFDCLFPETIVDNQFLFNFILYFVQPTTIQANIEG